MERYDTELKKDNLNVPRRRRRQRESRWYPTKVNIAAAFVGQILVSKKVWWRLAKLWEDSGRGGKKNHPQLEEIKQRSKGGINLTTNSILNKIKSFGEFEELNSNFHDKLCLNSRSGLRSKPELVFKSSTPIVKLKRRLILKNKVQKWLATRREFCAQSRMQIWDERKKTSNRTSEVI